MDNLVSLFLAAQRAFGERVHAVGDDQWGLPTPDTEWNVAALVAHLIDENRWVAPLVHGHSLEAAAKIVEGKRSLPVDGGVGGNLVQEWDEASLAAGDAFGEPGALERTVALSRGPTPATGYIAEMIFDHIVHAWDLGTAVGYTGELPADVVHAVYEQAKGMGELSSYGDMFAPAVPVPADAPTLDKLVALTGRDPRQVPAGPAGKG
jgi:uncharacterized protein (TIGR03086 family)